ncbi:MAG: heme lyase CcmF/NrfE family subunit, partial [Myxococcota bacterium]
GWGGWWFWDPVENASFMPWLMGTALVHSLATTEKRGSFKSWTLLLAIFTFSLSLLGTFLVRSGVLTSVHAFATDPSRGIFILAFLVVVVGGSLVLYAWRASSLDPGGAFRLVSRESFLLANNVLLVSAAGSVLLGTLYPLAVDALGLGKISVGPPYFNAVFVPLMVPLVFLMGVGPYARWKRADLPDLARRLRWALGAGAVTAVVLPFLLGRWSPLVALGLLLASWIALGLARDLAARWRASRNGLRGLSRSYLGMQLAHLGIAVFIVGVTLVGGYEEETDLRMAPGDTVESGGYTFRFDGVHAKAGPNYLARVGEFSILRDGREIRVLHPEKRTYGASGQRMTEAAIDSGPLRDLYVSLGEPVDDGAWSVRVYYKPFVTWIWGGSALMALGGLVTLSDRRYRLPLRRRAGSAPSQAPGSPHRREDEGDGVAAG